MKTLSSADKAAWVAACQKEGITFTKTMEHLAVEAKAALSIDWSTVLKTGIQIAIAILGVFGISLNPTPAKKACPPGCCDHCECCRKCLKDALKTVCDITHHMCCCDDECNYYG